MTSTSFPSLSFIKIGIVMFSCFVSLSMFSQDTEFYNLYFEGNSMLVQEKYEQALALYDKAINKFPEVDFVYYNRGNAKFGLKDYSGALLDYNKTIILNSRYGDAYYQRAFVKFNTGKKEEGCEDLKKAKKYESPGSAEEIKKNCK